MPGPMIDEFFCPFEHYGQRSRRSARSMLVRQRRLPAGRSRCIAIPSSSRRRSSGRSPRPSGARRRSSSTEPRPIATWPTRPCDAGGAPRAIQCGGGSVRSSCSFSRLPTRLTHVPRSTSAVIPQKRRLSAIWLEICAQIERGALRDRLRNRTGRRLPLCVLGKLRDICFDRFSRGPVVPPCRLRR
jgi:hypothetical protein